MSITELNLEPRYHEETDYHYDEMEMAPFYQEGDYLADSLDEQYPSAYNISDDDAEEEESSDKKKGVTDKIRKRGNRLGHDIFQRIKAAIFGVRTFDPLDEKSVNEVQEINKGKDKRTKIAAEFTQNAAKLVDAATPAPKVKTPGLAAKIISAVSRFGRWVKSFF